MFLKMKHILVVLVFFRLSLSLSNKVPLTSYRSAIIPSKPVVTSTLARNATSLPNVHTGKETKVKQKLRPKTSPGIKLKFFIMHNSGYGICVYIVNLWRLRT